jgi:branched-chain amino acid transport system permease protein
MSATAEFQTEAASTDVGITATATARPWRSLPNRALLARGVATVVGGLLILAGPKLFSWAGPAGALDFGLTVAMLVVAVSVLFWIGEISLAVVAQMGMGMVTLAWFQDHTSFPLAVSIVLVTLSSIPTSLILGLFCLRLRGVNFVIASLAFAGMTQKAFFQKVLGAGTSLHGRVKRPELLQSDGALYYLIALSLVAVVIGLYLLQRSRVGTALASLRDSETAFWTLGYSPAAYKLFVVCLSGAIATLAGAFYGMLQGSVPSFYFNPGLAIVYFGFAVSGGMGSIGGAVAGGLFFGAMPKYLEVLWPSIYNKFDFLFYGLVALLIILWVPGGLAGIGRRFWRRVEGRA